MKIKNTTLEFFGTELGAKLLDKKRIIVSHGNKTPSAGYKNGFEGSYDKSAVELGIICGAESGIIVLDFDDAERYEHLRPYSHVETRRGFHIYCAYDPKYPKTLHPKGLSIDLLSGDSDEKAGAPCYFAGINRTWVLPPTYGLANVDEVLAMIPDFPIPSKRRKDALIVEDSSVEIDSSGLIVEIDSSSKSVFVDLDAYKMKLQERERRYIGEVREAKFGQFSCELNKTWIENNLSSKMQSTKEGSRNTMLFRYGIEFARCELNMDRLEDAAVAGGQERKDVQGTIAQVVEAYAEDHQVSVLDRVKVWHEYASYGVKTDQQQQALDYIAAQAVSQNDLRPAVSQLALSHLLQIKQRSLSHTFTVGLPKKGLIKVHAQSGKWGEQKLTKPNNYELCLNDVPISEMSEQIDEILKNNKGKVDDD